MKDRGESHPRSWARPSMHAGAAAGALTVVLFTVVHGLFIVDIWFNIGPMVFSGAVCGLALVWSYNAAATSHSTRLWFEYLGACAALLIMLGATSLMMLDPRFTVAGLIGADDALGQLLPPAMPLMGAATLVGTGLLWLRYGRSVAALLPMLVSQALLVFFVGHNLAILGLLEMSSRVLLGFAEFAGLTLFLAGAFGLAVRLVAPLGSGRQRSYKRSATVDR